jgi:hypothetical protein
VQNLPGKDVKLFFFVTNGPLATGAINTLERLSYGSLVINVTKKALPGKNALAFLLHC